MSSATRMWRLRTKGWKRIKQHLFHPKIRQIAHYSPLLWVKNALFSALPKSHFYF